MLMLTVNYLSVIGRENVAAKRAERMKTIRKATKAAREAHEDLPI